MNIYNMLIAIVFALQKMIDLDSMKNWNSHSLNHVIDDIMVEQKGINWSNSSVI
jgi:hypothetical protein